MKRHIHTPGPIDFLFEVEGHDPDNIILRSRHKDLNFGIYEVFESEPNARLLKAAYNAFDSAARRLNVNAIELAERLADGGVADLVAALEECLPNLQGWRERDLAGRPWLQKSAAALAKVKGSAL